MLVLEFADSEILAYYKPPNAGPNVGGYLGRVFPGGKFHGITYQKLLALGSGLHQVEIDERARSEQGNVPICSTDDEVLGNLRWNLFMYQVGACTEGAVIHFALLAMTPNNVARAANLLPAEWKRRMSDFADQIPAYREGGGCRFYCSGQMMEIPDENLVAVQNWFNGMLRLNRN